MARDIREFCKKNMLGRKELAIFIFTF